MERGKDWKGIWVRLKKMKTNLVQIKNITRMDGVCEERKREALRDLDDEDDDDN